MNPQAPLQGAQAAIQGLTPNQAPAAPAVNVSMPSGFTPQGSLAPVSSAAPPASQFSQAINQMYAPQVEAAKAGLNTNAIVGKAATDVSNAYYQWQQQHMQDMLNAQMQQNAQNPANFKRAPSPDGGFNFTDGSGKPITAWQYGAATGQDMSAVLKGSQNPVDQQYLKDEATLNNLSNAWYSQDPQAQTKAAQQAGFKSSDDLHKTLQAQNINTPQDLWKAFMSAYPNVWGSGTGTSVGNVRGDLPSYGGQTQTPSTFLSGG
jgi:hypothetical protein